jgi:hypothetical protein
MLRTASSTGPGAGGEGIARSGARAGTQADAHEAPAPASAGRPYESRMNRIARRAHEIYEARGGQHGKAMDDWLQAEREVDAEMDTESGR